MKRAHAQFAVEDEERSRTWRIIGRIADAVPIFLVIVAVICTIFVALSGCTGWNDPLPIVPEPGNPCGRDWHSCGDGKCCYDTDVCRPGGYCAFGGLIGPTWGALPDAGPPLPAVYHGLTPEQVRRQQVAP